MANSEPLKKNVADSAQQAKEKAGQLAHDNRGKILGAFDKIASTLDQKTSGKYSDKIAKAKDAAVKGTDKIADQRPDSSDPTDTTGTTGTDTSGTTN